MTEIDAYSADSLFGGRLRLRQPRRGYRFSVDAVLLAHFARPKPGAHALDLGCGCGVVALIVAYREPDCRVTALEIQPDLARLAGENAAENGMAGRVRALAGDLRSMRALAGVLPPGSCDLVLCNPPYYQQGRGRISPEAGIAEARHDFSASLADCIRAAAWALKNRGRAAFIFPAEGQAALQAELMAAGLAPKRLRPVYSYPEAERACLALVEAVKLGGEGCELLPPFYLYERPGGEESAALKALYLEEPCWPSP